MPSSTLEDSQKSQVTTEYPTSSISRMIQQAVHCLLDNQLDEGNRLCIQILTLTAPDGLDKARDRLGAGEALQTLGRICMARSDYVNALDYFHQGLDQFEIEGSLRGIASCRSYLGVVYIYLGDYPGAVDMLQQAVQGARDAGDVPLEGEILNDLGFAYIQISQPEIALMELERSLRILREIDDRMRLSWALDSQGQAYLQLGRKQEALACFQEGLEMARSTGVWRDVVRFHQSVGEAYLATGDIENAAKTFQQELVLARQHGFHWDEGNALLALAGLDFIGGQLIKARDTLLKALPLSEQSGSRPQEKEDCRLLAAVYKQMEDYRSALRYFERYHEIEKALFNNEADRRLKNLQVLHQLQTAQKEAEIYQLRAQALQQEVDERRKAQEVLQKLASTDSLTGILNRRAFYEIAEKSMELSRQNHYPLSVVVMDIDHFKRVNDQFGHQVGDKVLFLVAERLRNQIRSGDELGRLGGEEFAALLPGISRADAIQTAERLCRSIAASPFRVGAHQLSITLSVGIAWFHRDDPNENIYLLLDRGDRAMYRAKDAGRNTVAVCPD